MNNEEFMNKGPVVETADEKAEKDDRIEDIRVSDDVTPNYGYPTFNNSGPSETMGKIGWALTDIDDRLAKATPGAGSVTSEDITDATEIGRGILTAESEEAVRDLIDAASTKDAEDLGVRIDREKQYRADGDAALEQKVADEIAARTEADNKLAEDLTNETTARTEADTALGERIDAEETARETAITDLTETVEENRTATEHSIATLTENLATESSDRARADLELTSTLQGEIQDREDADTALGERIDQEISDRTAADALKADKTYVDGELAKKLNADANAVSATKLETARNININGDATGTASFDGTADADITITLTNAGTTGRQLLKAETAGDANDVLGLLSVLDYKGQVASEIDLPEDAELGDVYNVSDTGMNYAWNGTSWDALGAVTTLTTLGVTATADELNYTDGVTAPIQTQLDAKQTKEDANAFETLVGETYAVKTDVESALALKQDAATAFDGKYTSLTEVPSEFTPKAHTHEIADVNGLQVALDGKVDDAEIADMLTKTEAAETYQVKGEYATVDAIVDMETKTEAAAAYQPKGDYATTEQIADMETKANAAATYATKTEVTEGLAAKQDAATAFDGKYTSLTEVPSQFTPAAHTHVMADITDLQDALDAKADASAIPTIPGNATTSKAGLMSAEDKTKLDGITKMAYIEDPAGDTVTKEEFIALRDALVAAGIMTPKA